MLKGHEKEHSKTSQTTPVESPKDVKDISNILTILDNHSIRTNPFGANVSGDNSYRRAERISAALHLVTNHVPHLEPLRTSIRNGVLGLLDILMELRSGFRAPASEKGQAALAAIRELISLVRLLAVAGYISARNASVVAEALDDLGALIVGAGRSELSEQVVISRSDLVPPVREDPYVLPSKVPKRTAYRPRNGGVRVIRTADNTRSDQITDILKTGGVLGIKDIVANIPHYSEKMIQRELAGLTKLGRVRKVGAKRWSKYQLVS